MKNKMFVIGDIHGQINQFEKLLTYWNEEEEQLLLIGDLGDRGENPKACFELARDLVENKQAICLRGNHEDMFINFLKTPKHSAPLFDMNGGMVTIKTFIDVQEGKHDAVELASSILVKYPWLKPFLLSLPLKYEWGKYVFTHAGVDLTLPDWKDSSDRDFVWIREGFYDQPNHTDKVFVFGHTVTATLHADQTSTDIWKTEDGKIGIDGGAVYGGTLHGVVFDEVGIVNHYKVDNKGYAYSEVLRKG